MEKIKIIRYFLLFILLFHSITCYSLMLNWAGCGITKKAFMAELAAAYEKKTNVKINLEGGGATKGIRKVIDRDVDMGGSCRFRIPEDNASHGVIHFNPVAWDALTVVAHKSNPVKSVTLDQLRDIYTGKITNWSQLGGQNQPMELLIRDGRISGVGHTIRQVLFGDVNIEFKGSKSYKSSTPLEEAVENNANAIAMTGISSARKRDFNILQLEGKVPSYENIKRGKYLLYRPLYIVTNSKNENYKEVKKFLKFAHSIEGKEIMRKNGVVPYLEAVWLANKLRKQWESSRKLGAR